MMDNAEVIRRSDRRVKLVETVETSLLNKRVRILTVRGEAMQRTVHGIVNAYDRDGKLHRALLLSDDSRARSTVALDAIEAVEVSTWSQVFP